MLSVVDRCCRTCANVAPDRYRGGIRCKMWDLPVSERERYEEALREIARGQMPEDSGDLRLTAARTNGIARRALERKP
jgi:hypothetical protein